MLCQNHLNNCTSQSIYLSLFQWHFQTPAASLQGHFTLPQQWQDDLKSCLGDLKVKREQAFVIHHNRMQHPLFHCYKKSNFVTHKSRCTRITSSVGYVLFIIMTIFWEGKELLLRQTSVEGCRPKCLNVVVSTGCQRDKVAAEGGVRRR